MAAEIPWPPKVVSPLIHQMKFWQAWYAGDRASLEQQGAMKSDRGGILRNLFVRTWQFFWGQTTVNDGSEPEIKVHVPLAKDIAKAKRAMLFADPPTIEAEGEGDGDSDAQASNAVTDATNTRLQEYVEAGIMSIFAGGAEIASALGGIYFRVMIDFDAETTFLTRVNPYKAFPTFDFGSLQEVTFWREIPVITKPRDNVVYRHLERHFTDTGTSAGIGLVEHQLWEGEVDDLGHQIAIDALQFPQMASIIDAMMTGVLDEEGMPTGIITTGTPGLDVVYIKNSSTNALWMDDEIGQNLGLPDIQGSEDMLDRLDFTMSSLMEELDLAKARITVPEYMLTQQGPGKGTSFDKNKRIWRGMSVAPTDASAATMLQLFQPDIRVDQHIASMQELTEVILRSSGFSAATFGEDESGQAATATEINARDRRTRITRGDAIAEWVPGMECILFKMLSVDLLNGWAPNIDPMIINVQFPKETNMSPQEAALFVQVMRAAGAMSLEEAVTTAHPDWDPDAVENEVSRIQAEAVVIQPDTFTGSTDNGGATDGQQ
jgi:hypothetical protein